MRAAPVCGCGGIGRRAGLRIQCRKMCRFKSCHPHQTSAILLICKAYPRVRIGFAISFILFCSTRNASIVNLAAVYPVLSEIMAEVASIVPFDYIAGMQLEARTAIVRIPAVDAIYPAG